MTEVVLRQADSQWLHRDAIDSELADLAKMTYPG